MTRIDIEEVHQRILNIAEAFDKICTKYDIPYYMLGGSMLGAIRHKGFIPWDDDMDFGVPIEYYYKLIDILEKELPEGMRCCTFENCEAIIYPFIKIEDTRTCVDDPRINLPINKKLGINVDVFPLADCDRFSKETLRARKASRFQTLIFANSTEGGRIRILIKRMLRMLAPFGKQYLPKKALYM